MRMLSLAFVLLALVGATACEASKPKPFETADKVAALLRDRWGSMKGSRSFDVVCDASRCTWTDYPAYVG